MLPGVLIIDDIEQDGRARKDRIVDVWQQHGLLTGRVKVEFLGINEVPAYRKALTQVPESDAGLLVTDLSFFDYIHSPRGEGIVRAAKTAAGEDGVDVINFNARLHLLPAWMLIRRFAARDPSLKHVIVHSVMAAHIEADLQMLGLANYDICSDAESLDMSVIGVARAFALSQGLPGAVQKNKRLSRHG